MEARRERWRRGIRRREAPASDWIGILGALGLLMAYGFALHLLTTRTPISGIVPGDKDPVVQYLTKMIREEAAARAAEEEAQTATQTAQPSSSFASSPTSLATTEGQETSGAESSLSVPASTTPSDLPNDKLTTDQTQPTPTKPDSPPVLLSSATTGGPLAAPTNAGTTQSTPVYSTASVTNNKESPGTTTRAPDAQMDGSTMSGLQSTAASPAAQGTDGTSVSLPSSSSNVASTIYGESSSASSAESSSSSPFESTLQTTVAAQQTSDSSTYGTTEEKTTQTSTILKESSTKEHTSAAGVTETTVLSATSTQTQTTVATTSKVEDRNLAAIITVDGVDFEVPRGDEKMKFEIPMDTGSTASIKVFARCRVTVFYTNRSEDIDYTYHDNRLNAEREQYKIDAEQFRQIDYVRNRECIDA